MSALLAVASEHEVKRNLDGLICILAAIALAACLASRK